MKIGENCRIYKANWGSEPYLISIGSNVTVASGVKFLTHDGSPWLFRNKQGRYYCYYPITIADNVFIGSNSIIMPGVNISCNVVVGAGSVVTKNLESGWVYAGNPARKIRSLEEFKYKIESVGVHSSKVSPDLVGRERVLEFVKRSVRS